MLNVDMLSADQLRAKIVTLENEAFDFERARCHGLARLKRNDASFYRRQLRQREALAA
jgi:hypothetical protein